MDYAIVGFPKCGTTTMGQALGRLAQAPKGDTCLSVHDSVYESYHDWNESQKGQYGEQQLLRVLSTDTDTRVNQNILTGIKCPRGLESNSFSVASWGRHLPDTKLIVGLRHPVLFFQSFYNFLTQNGWNFGSPYSLVQGCDHNHETVQAKGNKTKTCNYGSCPQGILCVGRARFHLFLAQLGKTSLDEEERKWLPFAEDENIIWKKNHHVKLPNDIFLYETSQLTDTQNQTRAELFWEDVAGFLNFPYKIPHDIHSTPGKTLSDPKKQEKRDKRKIDICDPLYEELRKPLMEYAIQISYWVCEYFVKSNGVFVSSPEHFCKILKGWRQDPCA
jgi:hypothetical protein